MTISFKSSKYVSNLDQKNKEGKLQQTYEFTKMTATIAIGFTLLYYDPTVRRLILNATSQFVKNIERRISWFEACSPKVKISF